MIWFEIDSEETIEAVEVVLLSECSVEFDRSHCEIVSFLLRVLVDKPERNVPSTKSRRK